MNFQTIFFSVNLKFQTKLFEFELKYVANLARLRSLKNLRNLKNVISYKYVAHSLKTKNIES